MLIEDIRRFLDHSADVEQQSSPTPLTDMLTGEEHDKKKEKEISV